MATEDSTSQERTEKVSLGDLISIFYEEYLALYLKGCSSRQEAEELASVATAATINELLAERVQPDKDEEEN